MGTCFGKGKHGEELAEIGIRKTGTRVAPANGAARKASTWKRRTTFTEFFGFGRKASVGTLMARKNTFHAISQGQKNNRQQRNRQNGLSDRLSLELIKLFEKLDKNGDGALQKNEAKAYLAALDATFGTLSKSAQHQRLQEFISSFPGAETGEITLAMWKQKAMETFDVKNAESDEEWDDLQLDAINYTRELLRTFNVLQK